MRGGLVDPGIVEHQEEALQLCYLPRVFSVSLPVWSGGVMAGVSSGGELGAGVCAGGLVSLGGCTGR